LKAGHTINALKFTVTNEQGKEQAFDTMLPAGTYTITPSNAGTTAGSYTFDYQTATLTIAKRDLTLTAVDQIIEYGGSANTEVAFNDPNKTVDVDGRVGGDELGTITINVAAEATSIATHEDAITLSVEGENANYNYTLVPGNLTITAPVAGITLTRVAKANIDNATVAQLIKDYDGTENVKVTIKFADTDGLNTLKPNKWYAFILPFETDAKTISNAFGYGIVDLLNTGNTDTHKTVFSLKMNTEKIPANTPFIVKVWDTVNMTAGVTFNNVKIEAPATYDEIAVSDAAGNKFIGSYTGIDGLGTYKEEYSGKVFWWSLQQNDQYDNNALKAKDTAYLRQMSAFSYVPGDVAAHEFIIEEFGGGTTVIKGINFENAQEINTEGLYNLNGMKLNSVPTQKGVYILNGKKVVIK
jgi:hypothetical protein